MNLSDILQAECVKVPLDSQDKQSAIYEMIDLMAGAGLCDQPDLIKEAVWQRETTRSTGIGHGIAIPHGKCTSVKQLTCAVAKPATPIDFEAIDGNPVDIIIMLVSPPDKTAEHIQALAKVSRMMVDDAFREAVKNTADSESLYALLMKQDAEVSA